jgi:type II secretion system protein H
VVPERVLPAGLNRGGFSAAELLVVMAIVGIIAATSVPWMITYWRAATLRAGAEELAAGLNRARQLAISQNQSVCVEVTGGGYRLRMGGCGAAIWIGLGTRANGFFALANNITVAANANPVFDYLGAAAPAATFTVTNPQGGATRTVVVSASGRVRIQ